MGLSEEDKKRLDDEIRNSKESFEREQARLRESSGKRNGCKWLQKRISLAEAWIFGFVAGVLAAIRMDD